MDDSLLRMIENVLKEDYDVSQFKLKKNDNQYKIFGLSGNKYKYLCTVDEDGNFIEYKKCPKAS